MDNMVLQLETAPAMELAGDDGLKRFSKELIRVGKYVKASAGQTFEVTSAVLDHWVQTFSQWIAGGNKVSIPLGHETVNNPDKNQGWVTGLKRVGDSLFGIMELLNPDLALVTDVSIGVPAEFTDGKGTRYVRPITHVALTTKPVVPGLGAFEAMSLSLGDSKMDVQQLASLLGMTGDVSEELVLAEVTKLKPKSVDPLVVTLTAESRQAKLDALVTAGTITPAVKDIIASQYIDEDALTLSLANTGDDGFETLFKVLALNKPVALGENTAAQLLELSNTRAANNVNPVAADVDKRRKNAGMDN